MVWMKAPSKRAFSVGTGAQTQVTKGGGAHAARSDISMGCHRMSAGEQELGQPDRAAIGRAETRAVARCTEGRAATDLERGTHVAGTVR